MKVLVTGAHGQLGTDVTAAFAGHHVMALGSRDLDVTDPSAVRSCIEVLRPDVVVNTAAYTAVDAAESHELMAYAVNATGPRLLAECCDRFGARLIQVSTDYVYDGRKNEPYVEGDDVNPLSAYGRTKLAGDVAVTEILGSERSTILRTSWVCGPHGSNMVKTVLNLMAADPERVLAFVDDQFGCPSFTPDLARMALRLATGDIGGVVHVTNQGAVSWYEFVRAILLAGSYSPDQVRPIKTADLQPARPAPRPANSVLANAVLVAAGVALLDHYEVALAATVAALRG